MAAAAAPLLLPTPLPASTLSLGQLLADPLDPSSLSFTVSPAELPSSSTTHSKYRDVVSHDEQGRLLSSLSGQPLSSSSQNILVLQADNMTTRSLKDSRSAFDSLRSSRSARPFLLEAARRNQPLYYITALQSLSNASFSRAAISPSHSDSSISDIFPIDPTPTKLELPIHFRRDSTMSITSTDSSSDAVFGLVARKVLCHVGPREEPHSLEDIGLDWTYHGVDGDDELQLSIGLGGVLGVRELRSLAGMEWEEERVGSDVSYETEDEEDGLSGF